MENNEEKTKVEKKSYMADFETTTNPEDCRVWCFSITEIGNEENTIVGRTIDDFFDHLRTLKSCNIYFHNLAFDGQFILSYLLTHGYEHTENKRLAMKKFSTIISDDGVFYSIRVKLERRLTIQFMDSLKKLPFSVRTIAKNFDLEEQKGIIDYEKERPLDYQLTQEEIDYVKNDTIIVAKALNHQFDQGLKRMTIASDALNNFKTTLNYNALFPVVTDTVDMQIRRSYRGGWVYVNPKYQDTDLEDLLVFDVNSLYPSRMYECQLPYGEPIYYTGEYQPNDDYPLYICCVIACFKLKPHHLPTIQVKNMIRYFLPTEYVEEYLDLNQPLELILTSVDLALFKDMYDIITIQYIDGYMFKGQTGFFKDYIDTWNKVKVENSGKDGKPALRTIAKLMLNSLYGRFATRTHMRHKIPYLKEDGVVGYRTSDEEIKDPVYTPLACFITAYARDLTIRSAFNFMQGKHVLPNGEVIYNEKDFFCYADTDSLHILNNENYEKLLKIDDKLLGYWKLESKPVKARYLRAKTYIEVMPDGELDVKCAGMPEEVKAMITWDNFHYGFVDYGHKLTPKRVAGGVVLETVPFTIKEQVNLKKKPLKDVI